MARSAWAGTSLATLLQFVLALVTSTILARLLGPAGRGAFAAVTIWATIATYIGNLSLNEATALLLASPKYRDPSSARLLSSVALSLQILAAAATAVCTALILPHIMGSHRAERAPVAVITALIFVPLTFADLHQKAVLQGEGKFNAMNGLRLVQPLAYAVGLIALALMHQFTWRAVIVAFLGSVFVSAAIGAILTRSVVPRWQGQVGRFVLGVGLRFQSANLALYASQEIDKVLVVAMLDDTSVGLYVSALAVATIGFSIASQTSAILLLPAVSAAQDPEQRSRMICRAAHAAMLALLIINGSAAIVTPVFVPLLFGKNFAPAAPITLILLIGMSLRGVRFTIDRGLRATGSILPGIIGELSCVGSFILLSLIVVSRMGVVGLAWSASFGQLVAFVVVSVLASRRLNVSVAELWGLRNQAHASVMKEAFHDLRAMVTRQLSAAAAQRRS